MSRRSSGYEPQPADLFPTPGWVVAALAEIIDLEGLRVWEPACGDGKMVAALANHGAIVTGTDKFEYQGMRMAGLWDFTLAERCPWITEGHHALITNPPYGKPHSALAEAFIDRGLRYLRAREFKSMAMLLPIDFACAGTRAPFFDDCIDYVGKIELTKRIKWFEKPRERDEVTGKLKPKQGPSENHGWFLWEYQTVRVARRAKHLFYAPSSEAKAA